MDFQIILDTAKEKYISGEWKKRQDNLKERLLSKPVVLYGVGFFGAVIARSFKENKIAVKCFCDSKKRGIDSETQLNIISPDELVDKYSDANVVISVANPSTEKAVYDTVVSLGFPSDRIFRFNEAYMFIKKSRVETVSLSLEEFADLEDGYRRAYEMFSDDNSKKIIKETIYSYLFHELFEYEEPKNSYFPEQLILSEHEVFVDGGLYTGDTSEEFIRRTNEKYKRIVGFDIDENNLSSARKNLEHFSNVDIISKGLWNKAASMHAELGIMAGSNIKDSAESIVELVSLDDFFSSYNEDDYPSFIKLDVEGSEKEAILGAADIIRNKKPKLAICVYHKPEDIFVLPELVKQLNPEYKLFLKKYSPYIWDTVMYAY